MNDNVLEIIGLAFVVIGGAIQYFLKKTKEIKCALTFGCCKSELEIELDEVSQVRSHEVKDPSKSFQE